MIRRTRFNHKTITVLLILTILSLFIQGCMDEPPHDNPVDPESDSYTGRGILKVTVSKNSGARLEEAIVSIEETGQLAKSNIFGEVSVEVPSFEWIHFSVQKEGYSTSQDSAYVLYSSPEVKNITLNGIPTIDSVKIVSGMDLETPSGPYYFNIYEVYAFVQDHDGLSDVTVSYHDSLGMGRRVLRRVSGNMFKDSLNFGISEISGIDDLWQRIGQEISISASDSVDTSETYHAKLDHFFRYSNLDLDMEGRASLDNDSRLLWTRIPSVTFSPITYRWALVYPTDESIVFMDTTITYMEDDYTIVSDPPSEYTVCAATYEGQIPTPGTSINWYLTLYDPHGSWIRARLQLTADN
ncbi:hypothetical protein K8I28_02290 [bacterium]|nr:hypothetical protein [bacterium]